MMVRVCNQCENRLEESYLQGVSLGVFGKEINILEIEDLDFCSITCLKNFLFMALEKNDLEGHLTG